MPPRIASVHAGFEARVPLLCPSSSLQTPLRSLNPSIQVANVEQPRRVTVLCKPDDGNFSALAERAQRSRTEGQVIARGLQAKQPSRRVVVPSRHRKPLKLSSGYTNSEFGLTKMKPRLRCSQGPIRRDRTMARLFTASFVQ